MSYQVTLRKFQSTPAEQAELPDFLFGRNGWPQTFVSIHAR